MFCVCISKTGLVNGCQVTLPCCHHARGALRFLCSLSICHVLESFPMEVAILIIYCLFCLFASHAYVFVVSLMVATEQACPIVVRASEGLEVVGLRWRLLNWVSMSTMARISDLVNKEGGAWLSGDDGVALLRLVVGHLRFLSWRSLSFTVSVAMLLCQFSMLPDRNYF